MVAKVSIDAASLEQLRQAGEVRVQNSDGLPLVLMTLDARRQLASAHFEDEDFSEAELRTQGAESLADPEGWGDPAMDVYDTMEGSDPYADAPL